MTTQSTNLEEELAKLQSHYPFEEQHNLHEKNLFFLKVFNALRGVALLDNQYFAISEECIKAFNLSQEEVEKANNLSFLPSIIEEKVSMTPHLNTFLKCVKANVGRLPELYCFGRSAIDILSQKERTKIKVLWKDTKQNVLNYMKPLGPKSSNKHENVVTIEISEKIIHIICAPDFSLSKEGIQKFLPVYNQYTLSNFFAHFNEKEHFVVFNSDKNAKSHFEKKELHLAWDEENFFQNPRFVWEGIKFALDENLTFSQELIEKIRQKASSLAQGEIARSMLRVLFSHPKLKNTFLLLEELNLLKNCFPYLNIYSNQESEKNRHHLIESLKKLDEEFNEKILSAKKESTDKKDYTKKLKKLTDFYFIETVKIFNKLIPIEKRDKLNDFINIFDLGISEQEKIFMKHEN